MPEHEASNVPHVDGSTSAGDASNAPRAPSSSQPVSPQDVTSPRRLMPSRTKKNSNPVKSNSRRSHQQVMADNAAIQAKEKEIAEMMRAQMEELALLKASLCAEEKAKGN
ncbi:hypothetical protein MPER_04719 [Moniliophthora perniciosa FA553]|nr:hypothetical protein MPER_04719 [Moniliophthora perniciosa FA553]